MLIITCSVCGNWIDALEIEGVELSFLGATWVQKICPCCAEVEHE